MPNATATFSDVFAPRIGRWQTLPAHASASAETPDTSFPITMHSGTFNSPRASASLSSTLVSVFSNARICTPAAASPGSTSSALKMMFPRHDVLGAETCFCNLLARRAAGDAAEIQLIETRAVGRAEYRTHVPKAADVFKQRRKSRRALLGRARRAVLFQSEQALLLAFDFVQHGQRPERDDLPALRTRTIFALAPGSHFKRKLALRIGTAGQHIRLQKNS